MQIKNLFIPVYYDNIFFEIKTKEEVENCRKQFKSFRIWLYPTVVYEDWFISREIGYIGFFRNPMHETLAMINLTPIEKKVKVSFVEKLNGIQRI